MPSIKLIDLAKIIDAKLYGKDDITITSIASIKSAKIGSITFLMNSKYRKHLAKCKASAIILRQNDLPLLINNNALVVKDPYLAYARIAQIFDTKSFPENNIASGTIIDPSVKLGNNISIGANSVIESDVILGDNVIIGAGCFIGKNSRIDSNSRLSANVTIYHNVSIGKNCLVQSGAVIGSDGFGYVNDDHGNWIKIPQLGGVSIGDNVEIGACTTIDRGSLDNTFIGNNVIIDNQCQIAHNVIIGNNTAIAGGVIMAGSLTIGNYCMIGGASVINGHIEICDKVTITGMGMVMRSIKKPGVYSSGIPIQPNKIWRKTAVIVMNINDIKKRLRSIEYKINK